MTDTTQVGEENERHIDDEVLGLRERVAAAQMQVELLQMQLQLMIQRVQQHSATSPISQHDDKQVLQEHTASDWSRLKQQERDLESDIADAHHTQHLMTEYFREGNEKVSIHNSTMIMSFANQSEADSCNDKETQYNFSKLKEKISELVAEQHYLHSEEIRLKTIADEKKQRLTASKTRLQELKFFLKNAQAVTASSLMLKERKLTLQKNSSRLRALDIQLKRANVSAATRCVDVNHDETNLFPPQKNVGQSVLSKHSHYENVRTQIQKSYNDAGCQRETRPIKQSNATDTLQKNICSVKNDAKKPGHTHNDDDEDNDENMFMTW